MLESVEHHQRRMLPDRRAYRLDATTRKRPDGSGNFGQEPIGTVACGERDEPDVTVELGREVLAGRDAHSCLADASDPGQHDEASARHCVENSVQLGLTSDERSNW